MAEHVYGRVIADDYHFGRTTTAAGPGQPVRIARGSIVKMTAAQMKAVETRLDADGNAAIKRIGAQDAAGKFVHDLTRGPAAPPEAAAAPKARRARAKKSPAPKARVADSEPAKQ